MNPRTPRKAVTFRFYGDLDDFLSPSRGGREHTYRFRGRPSVKDAIEAQGVPHTEVALILANGEPVGFDFGISTGDRIKPLHRCIDCNGVIRRVAKEKVWKHLEPKTKLYYDTFFQCAECGKVFWKGSHYRGLLDKLRHASATPAGAR